MKIVIDIPESSLGLINDETTKIVYEAIRNGTVLPEGHGALIDRDYFIDKYAGCGNVYCEAISCKDCNSRIVNKFDVDSAPAIISADSSEVE